MLKVTIARHRVRGIWVIPAMLVLVAGSLGAQQATLGRAMDVQRKSDQSSVRTQTRIGQLDDQTTEIRGDYRVTIQELDRIQIYNGHMQTLVNSQQTEIDRITTELENIVVVEQGIIPLMGGMIDTLDQFVRLDIPFNLEERKNRIDMLRTNMDSSELTISEKFRQIMNAYQIETSFGKDTEATVGPLDINGEVREVNFLRVGRILLAYQTPDRADTGFWNKNTRQWEALGDEYRKPISEGLRIANKQAAPDLLKLPVPAPENAQ
ncbi:MAG: DUF3450 domain-containing protein [Gammaproteobacteria bacterium]|nr:DUF3450 domain-containing protein [Gammaproteobacteria bacterium]MCZ6716658.1 DUF3450 domain-containing protein [Gammaproteobacteria bacterium]